MLPAEYLETECAKATARVTALAQAIDELNAKDWDLASTEAILQFMRIAEGKIAVARFKVLCRLGVHTGLVEGK